MAESRAGPTPGTVDLRHVPQATDGVHLHQALKAITGDLGREAREIGRENRPTVFILTYCRKLDLLYGSTLIFKTLRVGFPTAAVVVVDNASLAEARSAIQPLAAAETCRFLRIGPAEVEHHEFIEAALSAMASDQAPRGPLVFLDPDVCLWEDCEDFTFDALMAGYFIPAAKDRITDTLVMPRLHTSFLWIPNARELWDQVQAFRRQRHDFVLFRAFTTLIGRQWCRYNTGASLYAAIRPRVAHFGEEHCRRYDHLVSGSHVDLFYPRLEPKNREQLRELHEHARLGNLAALKGIWARQREIWRAPLAAVPATRKERRNG